MWQQTEEFLNLALGRLQEIWTEASIAPFELELMRLERGTKERCRKEPARAFYLLGLIATLRGNAMACRSHFNNAIRHSGDDCDVRQGFAAALGRMGLYSEAREQYEILHRRNPRDLDLLAELVVTSLASGRIQEAMAWIGQWTLLSPNHPFEEAESIAKKCAFLRRHQISDDDVESLQKIALGILDRENRSLRTINYLGCPEEDPDWITAELVLEESEEVVRDLNGRLKSVIASKSPPTGVAELVQFEYASGKQSVW
ncbi:MAG: hypothetical protein HQL57_09955 [Magnetococcales bacterium]|nr:hypothetical protein [Magnetococcales bacterium]MBF0157494.1 hypothetical protein [Magnetococcales bacterium]